MALSDETPQHSAPGAPGISPTWCSSAKDVVGCALGPSRLWFTIGGGIVNEIYYPHIDMPQIRDLGFIVADNKGFWVEVKRLNQYQMQLASPGVPAVNIVHTHERFTLTLRIVPDPRRDVLLLEVTLEGDPELLPYALLAPHLGGSGNNNTAEAGNCHGRQVLWAEQGPFGLALLAADRDQQDGWQQLSAGYVGSSDGWQDFNHNGAMRWQHHHAGPGNVALTGQLPRESILALGFGSSKEAAATLAATALQQPFAEPWRQQIDDWQQWRTCGGDYSDLGRDMSPVLQAQLHTSAMVLRTHHDKTFPGAMVASLSIPWGNSHDERGGYHLVWPRDLVESAGALLALGSVTEARDILRYLIATQHSDGHWNQNQWLDGKAYWLGVQLDQVAFPVLLAMRLSEHNALDGIAISGMVRAALGFIVRAGPSSPQDRWEEDSGINTFTLAACIAALVAGAPLLDAPDDNFVLELADYWNAHIEKWTTVCDTELGKSLGIGAYYVRVAPANAEWDYGAMFDLMPIKNHAQDPGLTAAQQIGVDFLQLVRFGLRRPDNPIILDSVRAADALLKVDTPSGPAWHRYTQDGYGEHADGSPFDGVGQGRAWPLLTGERGHYELSAGRDALPYLEAMAAMSSTGGMIPEQIWDSASLPERGLIIGRPAGSAMPLAWAHAEFVKLLASHQSGKPFDRPDAVWQRYQGQRPVINHAVWLPHHPINNIASGTTLLITIQAAGRVHWSIDGWQQPHDTLATATGLGIAIARIDTTMLKPGQWLIFTIYHADTEQWSDHDHRIDIT